MLTFWRGGELERDGEDSVSLESVDTASSSDESHPVDLEDFSGGRSLGGPPTALSRIFLSRPLTENFIEKN